nr:hypothetical protein [Tanacetum cinerariifolium]
MKKNDKVVKSDKNMMKKNQMISNEKQQQVFEIYIQDQVQGQRFHARLIKIQVAQKKVKIAFENADSSSRVVLIPSKIKYANKGEVVYTNLLSMVYEVFCIQNDNEKVNKPLFPSPEPSVSCIDDLDFFKDFENEFLAIVYNDALTSKSDFSTELTLCPQHIDEFDFKDETSLSEYDEVEQNILYFNDLFPFNIVYSDDLKSDKGNDENEIDMIQSSGAFSSTLNGIIRMSIVQECCRGQDMALPPRDQRHQYLRFKGLQYTKGDIANFETRLARIYRREVHRLIACSIAGRSQAPKKVVVTDLFYMRGLDVGSVNIPYLLARYLRRFDAGRKNEALILGPARPKGDARGVAEEAPMALGGGDEDEEMPQAVPPPPRTQGERIARLEK